jgi:hypothetical protein
MGEILAPEVVEVVWVALDLVVLSPEYVDDEQMEVKWGGKQGDRKQGAEGFKQRTRVKERYGKEGEGDET